MSECNKCNGTLFVCENHPDQEAHQCKHCGGAGMPCECTEPVSKWISVKEKLPDNSNVVLVYDLRISRGINVPKICFGFYRKNLWYRSEGTGWKMDVSHWMPLPNPPKEVV